jgi:arsenate reductase
MQKSQKPKVLFYCKHNSARSQMAEGLLRNMAADRFEIFSAGVSPRPIHPMVYTVMEEIGIDISGQTSKSIDTFFNRGLIDTIIIVCHESEVECPRLHPLALKVLNWPLDDPAATFGQQQTVLQAFRFARDKLKKKLTDWLAEQEIK